MENNIFKNAYFGKAYKTRDGRKAIYLCQPSKHLAHRLFVDGTLTYTAYNDYGRIWIEENEYDIVSEWQEPIDEEKLSELAWKHAESMDIPCRYEEAAVEGYKAGFRKAMEEQHEGK